jgi:hypothetical protein
MIMGNTAAAQGRNMFKKRCGASNDGERCSGERRKQRFAVEPFHHT